MCIKIAITDDHPMVISGLTSLLAPYPELLVSAVYNNGQELIDGMQAEIPDVLLLDMRLPDISGSDLVKTIRRCYPDLKILIITSEENPYLAKEMLRLGCLGYCLKSIDADNLYKAIITATGNEVYIDPHMQKLLIHSVVSKSHLPFSKIQLTRREEEILNLLCEGLNNYEIAEKLYLSHRSIEAHRRSLHQKFDVKNAAALVKKAIQEGWIK